MVLLTKYRIILVLTSLFMHYYSFANENQWMIPLKDQIQSFVQPYLLIILLNSSSIDINLKHCFDEILMNEFPSYLIDVSSKTDVLTKFSSLALLENPRNTILYILIAIETKTNSLKYQIRNTIDILRMLSPYNQRPKCLVITFDENTAFRNSSSDILKYAWQKNFLDVTILQIIYEKLLKTPKLYVYNYNPFNNSLNKWAWHKAIDIFPDKICNMYKHNIKAAAHNITPYQNIITNSNGSIIKIDGFDFELLRYLSKKLNLIINPVIDINIDSFEIFVKISNKALENGDIDMLSNPLTRSIFNYKRNINSGMFLRHMDYIAVVPILVNRQSSLISTYVLYIAYLASAQIFINMIIMLFKFNRYYWKVNYIFRILFNCPLPKSPRKSSEKVFFIFLIWLSFTQVNMWYNTLLDKAIIIEKYAFNTLEDIDNSNLSIYVNSINSQRFFQDNTTISNSLRSKSITVLKMGECFDILQKNRNVICTETKARAKIAINKYKEIDGRFTMRMAEPIFLSHPMTHFYESTSPYVEKFNQISQCIIESGIYFKELEPFEKIWETQNEKDVKHQTPPLSLLLLIVFMGGNIIALLVFIVEWLIKLLSQFYLRAH